MIGRISIALGTIVAVPLLVTTPLGAKSIEKREGIAHQHEFYSERFENPDHLIVYVVCNTSDSESDFFWQLAGFGVGENTPLPEHMCIERKDYVEASDESTSPRHGASPSTVNVREDGGEIPTVYWCDYFSIDRCKNSLTSYIVTFVSGLRLLGQGPSNEPIEIVRVNLESRDGRYRVDIQYSEESGDVIVVARNADQQTASFQDLDFQDLDTVTVADSIGLDDDAINVGLGAELPAIDLPDFSQTGGKYSFYYADSQQNTVLSIITVSESSIGHRLDTIPLRPQ